jgi:hypothetical protein
MYHLVQDGIFTLINSQLGVVLDQLKGVVASTELPVHRMLRHWFNLVILAKDTDGEGLAR